VRGGTPRTAFWLGLLRGHLFLKHLPSGVDAPPAH